MRIPYFNVTECIQVGEVLFRIDVPCRFPWKKKDIPFLVKEDAEHQREVLVKILFEEKLEEPQIPLLMDRGSIKVWADETLDIRAFYDISTQERVLYATSRWEGDQITIHFKYSTGFWDSPYFVIWPLLHLEAQLLLTNSLMLHCCYTQFEGKALLFTAPSGTGKTTHAEIWQRVFGSEIVNGDQGLLQQRKDGWDACGFPLSGSADECFNKSFPIKAIVIIRQSPDNYIEELSISQKLSLIYSECTVNKWNQKRISYTLDLLVDLIQKVPVIMLHCNMKDDAARTLHQYLYKGSNGTV